ncbi:MAG: hypothetical protein RL329_3384, partial [Bacteroidota bacterium]
MDVRISRIFTGFFTDLDLNIRKNLVKIREIRTSINCSICPICDEKWVTQKGTLSKSTINYIKTDTLPTITHYAAQQEIIEDNFALLTNTFYQKY